MKYPNDLYQKNRKKQNDSNIKNNHYLYMRNKPGHGWTNGIPDFNTIKLDQSLNWCKYSIPDWVRFNDKKEYLLDYAVVGIKTEVIRSSKKYNSDLDNLTWTVIHKPIEINYSHCELFQKKNKITNAEKRALRMTLRHKSKIYLNPNQKSNIFINLLYRIKILLL